MKLVPAMRAWNADGGAFEQGQSPTAMCAARFLAGAYSPGGDVRDPELSAGLAASEPSPKARPAGLSPPQAKLSARKSACLAVIFYDSPQSSLLLLMAIEKVAANPNSVPMIFPSIKAADLR